MKQISSTGVPINVSIPVTESDIEFKIENDNLIYSIYYNLKSILNFNVFIILDLIFDSSTSMINAEINLPVRMADQFYNSEDLLFYGEPLCAMWGWPPTDKLLNRIGYRCMAYNIISYAKTNPAEINSEDAYGQVTSFVTNFNKELENLLSKVFSKSISISFNEKSIFKNLKTQISKIEIPIRYYHLVKRNLTISPEDKKQSNVKGYNGDLCILYVASDQDIIDNNNNVTTQMMFEILSQKSFQGASELYLVPFTRYKDVPDIDMYNILENMKNGNELNQYRIKIGE
jgi:hypothetical protein